MWCHERLQTAPHHCAVVSLVLNRGSGHSDGFPTEHSWYDVTTLIVTLVVLYTQTLDSGSG